MQTTPVLPEVGKTYISGADPTFLLYVEAINVVEEEADFDAYFFVEGCAPEDIGDMLAMRYDMSEEEWNQNRFTPVSVAAQN